MPNWTQTPPSEPGDYWFVSTETYGSMMLVRVLYSWFKDPAPAPPILCGQMPNGFMWPVEDKQGYWWPERVERPPDGPVWEGKRYIFKGAGIDIELEVTG